ncbi:MAG: hypothetical protein QHH00_04570 [Methanomassiliicoccales archaeon]|jgi:predicted transcriptional regulator|nr:hypothetical protein [Methanomassiliicoccales archaeon]
MKIIPTPKYGPIHRFSDYHVYKTLQVLSDGERLGRRQLAQLVAIGEGSMRTIIEYLRAKKFVDVKHSGVKITSKGLQFLQKIPIEIRHLEPTEITMGQYGVAVKVAGKSHEVRSGIEQRDSAVKAGADGATTIVIREGRLIIPNDYDLDSKRPDIAKLLRGTFQLNEGDVIIVGRSSDKQLAEIGALTAAFDLL